MLGGEVQDHPAAPTAVGPSDLPTFRLRVPPALVCRLPNSVFTSKRATGVTPADLHPPNLAVHFHVTY